MQDSRDRDRSSCVIQEVAVFGALLVPGRKDIPLGSLRRKKKSLGSMLAL